MVTQPQRRRSSGKLGATLTFAEGMKIIMKREAFLANTDNKKRLITALRRVLENSECHTFQTDGDAGVLIVKKALEATSYCQKGTLLMRLQAT